MIILEIYTLYDSSVPLAGAVSMLLAVKRKILFFACALSVICAEGKKTSCFVPIKTAGFEFARYLADRKI